MQTSRRTLLRTIPAISAAAVLAACTTTTNGTTTTGTLDVSRIVTDGEAILTAAQAAVLAPAVVVLLGPNAPVAAVALATARATLDQIEAATGGTVTMSIDTGKVQGFVSTFSADVEQVIGYVQPVLTKMTGATATTIANYLAAIGTLLPLVSVAASLPLSAASLQRTSALGDNHMTERQALAIAHSAR